MITIDVALGLSCTLCSLVFFIFTRYFLRPLTYSRLSITQQHDQKISTRRIRTWFTYSNEERWQRLNLLISWAHALIVALLVVYSFLAYPDLHDDFVKHVNFVTYFTCSFSFGYFCYDLFDVISNRHGADLFEIILHHIVVLTFFGWNIFCVRNIGYQMFALLAEVNSIFLHARKLFHLYHIPLFVTIFVYHDRYRVGDEYYLFVTCILIPVMWIINPILFYRVLHTDFLKCHKKNV